MFGTLAVLSPADQELIAGFVINKFRGDARLLRTGHPHASRADRPPLPRRAAVDPRPVGRRRGFARPGVPSECDPPAAGCRRRCGWRSSACRGCRTSPTSTPWPPSPESSSGSSPVRPTSTMPTWSCSRARGRRWPTSTWLRAAGDRRGHRAARAARRADARNLRRVPDARRRHRRRRRKPGRRRSRASACCPPGCASPRTRRSGARTVRRWGSRWYGYEIHHGVTTVEGGEPFLDGCRVRLGRRHHLARGVRERRVPPRLPARPGRPHRAGFHASRRTPPSPGCARAGWTCSATWWPTTWTPTPSSA